MINPPTVASQIIVGRELLGHDADPNLREDRGTGRSPLEWALRGGHSVTADLLRAAGARG